MGSQVQDPTTGCIVFTGNGTQGPTDTIQTCVVACQDGICDTTYITLLPPPVPDTLIITPPCTTCPTPPICATADDLPGGTSPITYSSCGLVPSGMGSQVQDPTTGCIVFTGNGTQGPTDTIQTCVVACQDGICDTTYITLLPPPVPDTISVTPVCDTCSTPPICATADDLPGGTSPITYSSCGLMPTGMGSMVLDTTTGCIVFTGNGTQGPNDTVSTCVVACQDGVCDTTYINILPPPEPDLTPVITIYPSITHGIQNVEAIVDLYEINNLPTNGLITVYLSKDTRYNINFDTTATMIAGRAVNNSSWTIDVVSNPFFYIFTTNTLMPGFSVLNFGYNFTFNPVNSEGSTTINTIIFPGSGDEDNFNNNSDDTTFDYFIN
jgi:hypothetical protein